MSVERTCEPAIARVLLLFLLAPLAKAYPTTSLPDASSTTATHVTQEPLEDMCGSIRPLSFRDGTTAEPLTRGPCGEGQWVVHQGPHLRCARRPCPEGLVPVEDRCLSNARASATLCGGGIVHLDPTGLPRCCSPSGTILSTPATPVRPQEPSPTAVGVGPVKCPQTDSGDCAKEVRRPVTSGAVILPED